MVIIVLTIKANGSKQRRAQLKSKAVSGMMLTLLLAGTLMLTLNLTYAKVEAVTWNDEVRAIVLPLFVLATTVTIIYTKKGKKQ